MMSSGTSTDSVPFEPDGARDGLQPWQFFVLAALACATAALFLTRAQGVTGVILLSVLIGAAALVGLAGLRTVLPLVSPAEERSVVVGRRIRDTLEREKMLALRTLKELEFDRAMGKISDADFEEMSGRLRARAGRLIRQLDAGAGHRERIEQEVARRLAAEQPPPGGPTGSAHSWTVVMRVCGACETKNESDARFCKGCGARL
jgi:hypothetical protein